MTMALNRSGGSQHPGNQIEGAIMHTLWIVKGGYEGSDVFLWQYFRPTRQEVVSAIMSKARGEGYTGNIDRRLTELGWRIVEVEVKEIR